MALFDGSRPGPGRPRGSLNRWSKTSREAVLEVFENLGGVEAMTEWARKHPSDFYRGIYSRLLPTRTEVDTAFERHKTPKDYTDAEIIALIERARSELRAAKAQDESVHALAHEDGSDQPSPVS